MAETMEEVKAKPKATTPQRKKVQRYLKATGEELARQISRSSKPEQVKARRLTLLDPSLVNQSVRLLKRIG